MEINNYIENTGSSKNNIKRIIFSVLSMFISLILIITATVLKYVFVDGFYGKSSVITYLSIAFAFLLLYSAFAIYCFFSRFELIMNFKYLMAQVSAITFTYILCIYAEILDIFLMPVFLTAYLIAPLSRRSDAVICNFICNLFVNITLMCEGYLIHADGLSYISVAIMFTVGFILGVLVSYTVSYNVKKLSFIIKGVIVSLISLVVIVALSVMPFQSFSDILPHIAFMLIAVVAQLILAILLQPVFESVFNLVTNARLIELTDHNAPLIKRLLEEAPGTFNHSLMVANYAEVCATAIGENPYLARACAYYHDIGKLVNPKYFSENQSDYNPHDDILPEVSADIIRNHARQGYSLCKEYRIPEEVANVTIEHHGTLPLAVFYQKAKQLTDSFVDVKDYSYVGPTPKTKIAAIIMLCDSGEAAIRAMDNPDAEKVDKLLHSLINQRISQGQFDNCDITLRDLDVIRTTIIDAFGGQYHRRVKYPGGNR